MEGVWMQGSKGIWQWLKNWYTSKFIPSIDYNLWLKRLDTQNSIKVSKVVKPTNKKTLLQNFGDKCNKQPNVPSLPEDIEWRAFIYLALRHTTTTNSFQNKMSVKFKPSIFFGKFILWKKNCWFATNIRIKFLTGLGSCD